MNVLSVFILPGIIFIIMLAFGFWLSHLGKPYHGLLFNIHKLLALGAVVVTALQVSRFLKNTGAPGLVLVLLLVAGLCVIALFASGTLLSLDRLSYDVMRNVHRVATVVLVLAMLLLARVLGR
jgi:hypothetical protein